MTPALTHEDASARLLDLVYGEAEGAARAAIEAHVAGCAQCQADLAALGDTHALLRGTFEELPVPARAHARILEAAKAAVAPGAARVPAAKKVAAPSFWERMRGRWTLPTLATVGAIAVVVISSRMFLDPNSAFEQIEARRAPAEVEPQAEPPPPTPVQAPTGAAPAAPAEVAREPAPESEESIARRRALLEQLRLSSPGGRGALRSRSVDERLRAALGRLDGSAQKGGAGGVASGGGSIGAAAPADKIAAKPTAAPERRPGGYASPPAGWAAESEAKSDRSANSLKKGGPPAASQAAVPKAAKRSEALDDLASAPVAAAPPPAPAKRKVMLQKDVEDRDEAPAVVAAAPAAEPMEEGARSKAEATSRSADEKKQKEAAPTVDALARKAEQLYVAGRWPEAVAAYRELLRRFPDAGPATQWRSRLVQSQRQESSARAKAAPAAQ